MLSRDLYLPSTRLFPDQVVRNGAKSCVIPYATPGGKLLDAIEKSVNTFIQKVLLSRLILLQNHGIIVASTSIKIYASTMMCENLQKYTWVQSLCI